MKVNASGGGRWLNQVELWLHSPTYGLDATYILIVIATYDSPRMEVANANGVVFKCEVVFLINQVCSYVFSKTDSSAVISD